MRTPILTALGLAAAAGAIVASPAEARGAPGTTPMATLQQGVSGVVAAGAPGALALVHGPSGTLIVKAGVARLGAKRRMGADTPFRAGSVTKTFVGVAVLQLVAEGRLALDDTVEQRLPGALLHGREITVRQLLSHTSGLPDLGSGRDGEALLSQLLADRRHVFSPAELVGSVARRPLLFRPGQGWGYSNAGYVVLGMIVEKVTGERLTTVLRKRIIAPLDLQRTRLASGAEMPAGAVRGYLAPGNPFLSTPGGVPVDVTEVDPSWTWAAGGLMSTASDISRFYRALLAGRLVPSRLLRQMIVGRPVASGAAYGLGLLRLLTPCGFAYGHDGEIFGYTTLALATRDARRSVVLVANISVPESGTVLARLVRLAPTALCPESS